jgi:hypothetical protein
LEGQEQISSTFISDYVIYPRHGVPVNAPNWVKTQLATELVMLELLDYTTFWPYPELYSYYEQNIFIRNKDANIDSTMKTAIINADYYICYYILSITKTKLSADFLIDYYKLVELCYTNSDNAGTNEWALSIAQQFIL